MPLMPPRSPEAELEGHRSRYCPAVTRHHSHRKLLVHLKPDRLQRKAELQIASLPCYDPI